MKTVLNCGFTAAEILEMVVSDYKSMVLTMTRNMAADAEAGYSPAKLAAERAEIEEYCARKDAEIENWNDTTARYYARKILMDEF